MALDQAGLQVLSDEECLRLLAHKRVSVGRLAFVDHDKVLVLPVNYRWHDGAVVIRTGPGVMQAAGARGTQATFEVDEVDVAWREGWSVLAHGRLEEVTEPDEADELRQLPLHPWAEGDRQTLLRLRPESVSGRRIL